MNRRIKKAVRSARMARMEWLHSQSVMRRRRLGLARNAEIAKLRFVRSASRHPWPEAWA
jgi:hypothetical protein